MRAQDALVDAPASGGIGSQLQVKTPGGRRQQRLLQAHVNAHGTQCPLHAIGQQDLQGGLALLPGPHTHGPTDTASWGCACCDIGLQSHAVGTQN